jgi:hypothetical protein
LASFQLSLLSFRSLLKYFALQNELYDIIGNFVN